jgi:hypothetical protein
MLKILRGDLGTILETLERVNFDRIEDILTKC